MLVERAGKAKHDGKMDKRTEYNNKSKLKHNDRKVFRIIQNCYFV